MEEERLEPLLAYFSGIEDPRIERKKKYPLINVLVITLLAVMAFGKGWEET